MTPQQIQLVQSTWKMVVPIASTAADFFYGRLFRIAPQVKPLFPDDMAAQKTKLMATIGVAVAGLNDLPSLVPVLQGLGLKHVDYGVRPQDYQPVGAALLWTLQQGLGDKFTPQVKEAWAAAYVLLSSTMVDAANAAA
ncbi:MAG: globin family protein [Phycisphaeraceae bacterium]